MEFSKKEIHTSVLTQSKYSQITVDDDFTIPDGKGDMEKLVAKEGHIILESMVPEDGKVRIEGFVCVRVLYRTGGEIPRLCEFQSEIPFEDVVTCDGSDLCKPGRLPQSAGGSDRDDDQPAQA